MKVLISIIIVLLSRNLRLVHCQIFFYDSLKIRNLPKIFLKSFEMWPLVLKVSWPLVTHQMRQWKSSLTNILPQSWNVNINVCPQLKSWERCNVETGVSSCDRCCGEWLTSELCISKYNLSSQWSSHRTEDIWVQVQHSMWCCMKDSLQRR